MKRLYGIRGATGADNSSSSITENTGALCREIFSANGLDPDDIVSIQFTITKDLTALNPAAALRHSRAGIDVSGCALFCGIEPECVNALPRMIRVLVTAYMPDDSTVHHVYRNGAEVLRPDFVRG